jgi:hypothetical protein
MPHRAPVDERRGGARLVEQAGERPASDLVTAAGMAGHRNGQGATDGVDRKPIATARGRAA